MSDFQGMVDTLNLVYLMNQREPLTKREKMLARAPFLWENNDIHDIVHDLRNSTRYEERIAAKAYDLLFENMFE